MCRRRAGFLTMSMTRRGTRVGGGNKKVDGGGGALNQTN